MPRNKGQNSASNRNKKKGKQEPFPADTNPIDHSPRTSRSFSRSRNKRLLIQDQNKTSPEKVSNMVISNEQSEEVNVIPNDSQLSSGPVDISDTEIHDKVSEHVPNNKGALGGVSDNRGSPTPVLYPLQQTIQNGQEPPSPSDNQTKDLQSTPEDPWHLTFTELRAMRSRMQTLEKLEAATVEFAQQMQTISSRTATTEATVKTHSTDITKLQQQVTSLHNTVHTQQGIIQELRQKTEEFTQLKEKTSENSQAIMDLQKIKQELLSVKTDLQKNVQATEDLKMTKEELMHMKQDFGKKSQSIKEDFNKSSRKNISEMNKLLEAQKNQVESFRSIRNDSQQEAQIQKARISDLAASQETLKQEVDQKIKNFSDDISQDKLTRQASDNMRNIVIIGLPEHATHSAFTVALRFFKSKLRLRRLDIEVAYRMGKPPLERSSYTRPLMVKFNRLSDRNAVWRLRNDIPQDDEQQTIRIQADLPKQLREDVTLLYKVQKVASKIPEYQSATIRDYALFLHDKKYTARQLEALPHPLRPSSLACKTSHDSLVFFSKHSPFSNHHPSIFEINNTTFHNMEQYLAFKKAEAADDEHFQEKALKAKDPVQAKSILNALRHNNIQDWQDQRALIAMEGLREKFRQNPLLAQQLKDTKTLQLGEASKNPIWGIGMTLQEEHVSDLTKWNASGNLLGILLMQLRSELSQ